jgi:hypothetical protein
MLNKQALIEFREWLSLPEIDDGEELWENIPAIKELIDFWLERN